ncbi:MAG: uncharacterized protein A8A55_3295, partial [Amphiamblys sp. WSBS2006]
MNLSTVVQIENCYRDLLEEKKRTGAKKQEYLGAELRELEKLKEPSPEPKDETDILDMLVSPFLSPELQKKERTAHVSLKILKLYIENKFLLSARIGDAISVLEE